MRRRSWRGSRSTPPERPGVDPQHHPRRAGGGGFGPRDPGPGPHDRDRGRRDVRGRPDPPRPRRGGLGQRRPRLRRAARPRGSGGGRPGGPRRRGPGPPRGRPGDRGGLQGRDPRGQPGADRGAGRGDPRGHALAGPRPPRPLGSLDHGVRDARQDLHHVDAHRRDARGRCGPVLRRGRDRPAVRHQCARWRRPGVRGRGGRVRRLAGALPARRGDPHQRRTGPPGPLRHRRGLLRGVRLLPRPHPGHRRAGGVPGRRGGGRARPSRG